MMIIPLLAINLKKPNAKKVVAKILLLNFNPIALTRFVTQLAFCLKIIFLSRWITYPRL